MFYDPLTHVLYLGGGMLFFVFLYHLIQDTKPGKDKFFAVLTAFIILFVCMMPYADMVRSSLGDMEQPISEWLVGKKGYVPVLGTPQRTVMSGQWINADNTLIIDWDNGTIYSIPILTVMETTNAGEAYDLLPNGGMALFGTGLTDTQPEVRDLPDTVTE